MRLRKNRIERLFHRAAIPKKDNEGNSYVEYGRPKPFLAETWPGGGKLQAQMYGTRLSNIRNCRLRGRYEELRDEAGRLVYRTPDGLAITVGDGICFYSGEYGEPDYKVVAIYPYHFLTLEAERI